MVKANAPAHATDELHNEPDDGGELDEKELAALRAIIAEGRAAIRRGEYSTLEEVLSDLDEEERLTGT